MRLSEISARVHSGELSLDNALAFLVEAGMESQMVEKVREAFERGWSACLLPFDNGPKLFVHP